MLTKHEKLYIEMALALCAAKSNYRAAFIVNNHEKWQLVREYVRNFKLHTTEVLFGGHQFILTNGSKFILEKADLPTGIGYTHVWMDELA